MPQTVDYSTKDRVAHIVFSRPPVNALNLQAVRDIIEALRKAGNDPDVGAVIISSAAPKVFCAGLDLDQLQGKSTVEVHELLTALYLELYEAQRSLGKPSIAAVTGAARGAGMTLAVSCDVLLAGESASFGYPEIDVGLIPGIHFVHLPRIIGKHRAFELLFSGRRFGPAEAERLGLISGVLADDDVLPEARRLAETFASKSPTVMRMARAAYTRINDAEYRRSVAEIVESFCVIASTDDAREGVAAFAERRKPKWTR